MKKLIFSMALFASVVKADVVNCSSSYQGKQAQFIYSSSPSGPGTIVHNVNTGSGHNSWQEIGNWTAVHTDITRNHLNLAGQEMRMTPGKQGVVHIEAQWSQASKRYIGRATVIKTSRTLQPPTPIVYPITCIAKF